MPSLDAVAVISRFRSRKLEIADRRKALCVECNPAALLSNGRIKCPKCGCSDPTLRLDRCPDGHWGGLGAPGCPVPYGSACPKFEITACEKDCFQCKHPDAEKRATWLQSQRARVFAEARRELSEPERIHAIAEAIQSGTGPRVSVVIASLNEGDFLSATVASIKADLPNAEIIVVDDGSPKPEPISTIRNAKRLGVSQARHIGCKRANGDVVAVFDGHSALDADIAQWFWDRTGKGELWPKIRGALGLNAGRKLSILAAASLVKQAIVYCGCNLEEACGLSRNGKGADGWPDYGPCWQTRRKELPRVELWETAGCLGAVKIIPRALLDLMGGWPKLCGYYWRDEETLSLLAAAHGIPIYSHLGVEMYHLFRGGRERPSVPVPFPLDTETSHNLTTAAMYRLLFDDDHLTRWRPGLLRYCGGAALKKVLEDEEWNAWRKSVQARFKFSSAEIVAEVERRMARERSERIPWDHERRPP